MSHKVMNFITCIVHMCHSISPPAWIFLVPHLYESPCFPSSSLSCFHITCVLPTLNKPHSEKQIPFVSLIFRNWTSYMCIWMMYMRGNTPKGIMKMQDKILRERQGREWEQNGLWRTDSISLWNHWSPVLSVRCNFLYGTVSMCGSLW